ncbi:TetR/AcrR family transcriptional regulator [Sinanaerobacter chloroacetimidivorans]|jgi:AcrR family transcriptional regulator|uniref:TetR/AcrR family transcriptional regulator n=1 Tax=Sinanaerobacter chloroacetimidivorans TaxID=2818044 RepID=A0A8J8B326_9FIRM|nr:TetR/AcrR family transcriptional regulator [Sinanaerobacter chloroacetimidivorans]MBR0599934.1 TetR/AcrR family transcriptional regulator [Sinanaerobacter chloroacetimidivorans]
MKNSRRELNKIKCRERILKASRRLFSSKGYENTLIEDVARKAEISKATLYNYFPNKESLLMGIAQDELDQIKILLNHEYKDMANSEKKLRRILEVFILDSIPFINLSRKITYLNSCEGSYLYATRLEMMGIFRSLIVEAQEQNIFKKEINADDIVDIVMSVYLMAQFEWPNIAEYSLEFCKEKLNRILDLILADIYV